VLFRSFCVDPRGVIVVDDEGFHGRAVPSPGDAALEHVANRPIVEHVIEEMESAGVRDVVVASTAERAGEIRKALAACEPRAGLRLRHVERRGPIDLARALRLVTPMIGEAPCIVHLASGLLGEPLTPLVDRLRTGLPDLVVHVHHQPGPYEHLSLATRDMLHIAELPGRATLGMAGVWLFGPGALQCAGEAAWRSEDDVDLTSVADQIAAAGGSFQVRLAPGWRKYAGNPLDLLELNHLALERLEMSDRRANGNGNDNGNRIEGRVQIHADASVRASVIVGPTIIGRGARVTDAYIGPYTSIGEQARIEGAEIERSIIASGASITHIGGRLVASVVGRDARIFRDFSLPRALRLRVGHGTEVALC
jgi:glucose-1-phosphate thymidylyltransferase